MTQVLTPKLPGESVAYLIPWAHQLGDDWIDSYTLTIDNGTITIASQEHSDQNIVAVISGGANAETATLSAEIVTHGGQRLKRAISLLITDDAVAVTPETTTKRTIVQMAFEACGLADYEFNTTSEEKASALRKLDAMMAQWAGPGMNLNLGYNAPTGIGLSDLSDPAGVPDSTLEAVALSLAKRIAPDIGKTLAPGTLSALTQAMSALRAQYAVIPHRTLPWKTPIGAGGKPLSTWQPFAGSGYRRW